MMLLLQMTMMTKNVIESAGNVEIKMMMGVGGSCHHFLMLLELDDARSYSRKRC